MSIQVQCHASGSENKIEIEIFLKEKAGVDFVTIRSFDEAGNQVTLFMSREDVAKALEKFAGFMEAIAARPDPSSAEFVDRDFDGGVCDDHREPANVVCIEQRDGTSNESLPF